VIGSYALITPARDEEKNLPRLAACLSAQTLLPAAWRIVDNGSSDRTFEIARDLAAEHDWIEVISLPGSSSAVRGGPVVRAFNAGLDALDIPVDVVVKHDADVSVEPEYFQRLLARFDQDPRLGMASGSAFEQRKGVWEQRHVTGTTVWGASRAYRWACLQEILPLEERMAWDGIDEFKANVRGWHTVAFEDLPFRHHRREGERDGSSWRARVNQGRAAHYLGYRAWYLALRALWNARHDPGALAMVGGYLEATVLRKPRIPDQQAREYLRQQQGLGSLTQRAREAAGRRSRAA
jgi:glycosyltransferase involved in cell wall biosynthesis